MPSLSIREVRRGCKQRALTFDECDERITSVDVVRSLSLAEGEYPDAVVVLRQVDEAEPSQCMERSLRLLNYRERSVAELRGRLAQDGYPPAVVTSVIERLVDLQLLDDARFAGCFVRSKQAAGWGSSRIGLALRRTGVSDEVAADALPHDAELEFERAFAIARRRPATDRKGVERALGALVRKGYSFDVALRAAKAAMRVEVDSPQAPEYGASLDAPSGPDVP